MLLAMTQFQSNFDLLIPADLAVMSSWCGWEIWINRYPTEVIDPFDDKQGIWFMNQTDYEIKSE